MTSTTRAPIAHLAVLAVAAIAAIVGGSVAFGDWGAVPVHALAAYAGLAASIHAASRWTEHTLLVRGLAWLVLAAMPLQLTELLRLEVLGPIVALGVVDLARHEAGLSVDARAPATSAGKAVAGLATLALLAIVAVLATSAKTTGILVRLGVVGAVGWALVSGFALRPATRTPRALLLGAGAFASTFGLLAGPVVPLGPLASYWVTILAVTAAILTATIAGSDEPVREEHQVHQQTVRSLPDPAVASLADRVGEVVRTGTDTEAFSRRIEAALDRDEGGRLLGERVAELRERGLPEPVARQRALAALLDVDGEEAER